MSTETEITITTARPEHVPSIIRFQLAMAQETEGKDLNQDQLEQGVRKVFEDKERGVYLVALEGMRVVGVVLITTEWSDWRKGWFWWLQSVYVAEDRRKSGVFRALYEFVKESAKSREDVCGLRLYVDKANTDAFSVYRALGMDETNYALFETEF